MVNAVRVASLLAVAAAVAACAARSSHAPAGDGGGTRADGSLEGDGASDAPAFDVAAGPDGGSDEASDAGLSEAAADASPVDSSVVLPTDGGPFVLPSGDYVVAPGGSDANDGLTLATPFLTIGKCASVVTAGKTCFLRAGTYRETVTPGSGIAGNPIVFQSVPGESVSIRGADLVTSAWSLASGAIYTASVSIGPGLAANQVFVDGVMVPEARWPNAPADLLDGTTEATAGAGTTSTMIVDPNLPGGTGFWNGAQIHLRGTYAWTSQSGTVTAQTGTQLTFSGANTWDPDLNANPGSRYYLFGIVGALDAASEWFYDPSTMTLSLWAPDGNSPTAHQVEVKQRNYAFDLSGQSYVSIAGVNLFACTILTDYGSSHIDLGEIGATYVSHFTSFADNPYSTHQLDTGIILQGTNIALHDSEIAWSAGNGVSVQSSSNTVNNCLIHDTDYAAGYLSPVLVTGSGHTITNNTLYRTGRDGILFTNDGSGKVLNHTVSSNDIYCFGALNQDEGAVYGASLDFQGTSIDHNWAHDLIPTDNRGFTSQGLPGPVYPATSGAGIYLDNGSSNGLVHHNVTWNNAAAGVILNGPNNTGNRVDDNTLGSGQAVSIGGIAMSSGNAELINDIFLGTTPSVADLPGTRSNDAQPTAAEAPTYFVNLAGNDYQLSGTSPAIGAGTTVTGVTNGVSSPDEGAYQHGVPARTPGCTLAGCAYASPVNCYP